MSCRRVRAWLHREADTLDEAQRLVLDDHLVACARCRGDRERLRAMRRIGTALAVPPAGAREYQRAIARALLEGTTPAPARRDRWSVPMVIAAATVAVATAIAIGLGVTRRGEAPAEPPSREATPVAVPAPHAADSASSNML